MRVIVTGAGGFVGRHTCKALIASGHDVVRLDRALTPAPASESIEGDLCDPAIVTRAFAGGCDAVVHLATVPGGDAELDPLAARRTNVDASMLLTEAAARAGTCPKFLFASSIAVFGAPLPPEGVDDDTPLAPRLLYGAHKAMIESWIATLTRRGEIDGLSLRLPGIVARPIAPSGMKSAFMSDIFHALRGGMPFVSPVSAEATMWLMSVDAAAKAFVHALAPAGPLPEDRAVTLPALRVRMDELATEIARRSNARTGLVSYEPDAALETAFGALPPLNASRATDLGFHHDGSTERLVASALATIARMEGQK